MFLSYIGISLCVSLLHPLKKKNEWTYPQVRIKKKRLSWKDSGSAQRVCSKHLRKKWAALKSGTRPGNSILLGLNLCLFVFLLNLPLLCFFLCSGRQLSSHGKKLWLPLTLDFYSVAVTPKRQEFSVTGVSWIISRKGSDWFISGHMPIPEQSLR